MRFENLYVVELIFRFGVLQAKILLFSRRTAYLRTGYDNLVRKVAVRSRRCRETIFVCRSQLVRVAKSSTRADSSDRRICAFESARPTADCRERTALSKRLTRSRELSAQNALVWIRGFRVFRLFLARVPVRCFSFFSFTSSPTYCNAMIINVFSVKVFAFCLHPLPHASCLHRSARKVCFSAGLFSKARKYRPETADGEGKNQKPSPQTNSTSTDCAQWVKE